MEFPIIAKKNFNEEIKRIELLKYREDRSKGGDIFVENRILFSLGYTQRVGFFHNVARLLRIHRRYFRSEGNQSNEHG